MHKVLKMCGSFKFSLLLFTADDSFIDVLWIVLHE